MNSLYSLISRGFLAINNGYKNKHNLFLYVISLFLHIFFFLGLFFIQNFNSAKIFPQAISVNLGSLVSNFKEEINISQPNSVKKSINSPKLSKTNKIKTKANLQKKQKQLKKLKSIKKKSYKSSNVAINAKKKQVKKNKTDALNNVLARLKKQVEKNKSKKSSIAKTSSNASPSANTTYGYGSNKTGKISHKINLYNLKIISQINQNWAFNERVAGTNKNLEAIIGIKILKNGQIRNIQFEKNSGNKYFDNSVFKAVKKSNPLPELPKGYPFYKVALRFTPYGLK
ncbi:MAG: hypothetical protein B6I26_01795 [Desulfobacteraceae bacterium 4572_130]|nr:MAG: hypothetical protein B6I26_01795 [Desulfobacteraceae bacterium 4572_130]